jgi:hypothetical protein
MKPTPSAASVPATIAAGTHHENRRCREIIHGASAMTTR